MVEDPSDYRWSSCPAKTGLQEESWLDFDLFYQSLGRTVVERAENYTKWLRETVPEGEWELIRAANQRGQLTTSSKKFEKEVFKKLGRRIELRGPGRPKKSIK